MSIRTVALGKNTGFTDGYKPLRNDVHIWITGAGGQLTLTHPNGNTEVHNTGDNPLRLSGYEGVPFQYQITAGTSINVYSSDGS